MLHGIIAVHGVTDGNVELGGGHTHASTGVAFLTGDGALLRASISCRLSLGNLFAVAGVPSGKGVRMKPARTLIFHSAALLVVAGCGLAPAEELPINDQPHTDDPVVSVCAPGEPKCVDTGVVVDLDDPDSEPFPDSTTAPAFHGELTVSEAVGFEGEGTLAVRGHLFFDADGESLCEELAPGGERYECGVARIPVENLSYQAFGDLIVHHDGLTYSQEPVSVLGEMVDGVLVVSASVSS